MDLQRVVGGNIKSAREKKKLTLDAAARQTGVSRSMLAQIEKGEVNPTISILWRIANGYKVSFTSLLDDSAGEALLIRADDAPPLAADGGRYLNFPAFPFQESRLFETYRIQIAPEGFLAAQPHMAGTEEYITVFAGEVEICAGGAAYRLRVGDSLRFRADAGHSYRNVGKAEAQLSMLIYYAKE